MREKVIKRLLLESVDLIYDKDDRKRFIKIRRVLVDIPNMTFNKLFIKNKNYDFYKGFCYARSIRRVLSDIEYDICLGVIDNIKTGYYGG